ncbi:hypothetical protein ACFP3I_00215 [Chryseobacterium arachidis]|uniref:hypothetical protein n=1 Tax=Chryseobacterium arachidis TaxID=1416778 RepID=UPI00361E338F
MVQELQNYTYFVPLFFLLLQNMLYTYQRRKTLFQMDSKFFWSRRTARVGKDIIGDFLIALPPLEEQKNSIKYIKIIFDC